MGGVFFFASFPVDYSPIMPFLKLFLKVLISHRVLDGGIVVTCLRYPFDFETYRFLSSHGLVNHLRVLLLRGMRTMRLSPRIM
jgi:hypothetical protein